MSAQKIKVYSETAKELELLFRPYNKFQLDGFDGTCDCAIDMDGLTNNVILAGRVIKPSADKDVFIIDNGDGKSGEGDVLLYEESGAFKFAKLFADRSGQTIPTEISDGLNGLESKKDQSYADIFAPAAVVEPAIAPAVEPAIEPVIEPTPPAGAPILEEPPLGQVRGTVIDATTGAPIANAVVSFPNTDKTNLSTSADGNFLSYDFPPGDLMIRITHPRYENFEVTNVVTVEAGKEKSLEFKLIPLQPKGTVNGCVSDDSTSPPTLILGAKFFLTSGTKTETFETDPTGCFAAELPTGDYVMRIEAQGYLNIPQRDFNLAEDHVWGSQNSLTKRPLTSSVEIKNDKIELKKPIYFLFNKSELDPNAKQLLDEVVDLLTSHTEILKVEIGGHTDSQGPDAANLKVSLDRAKAVRTYLLEKNVSSSRMEVKGYGETQLIARGSTRADHEKNRRIEFKILETSK